MLMILRWIFGLLLSVLIGGLGYRANMLAPGGVTGAIVIGTLVFGSGGWIWGGLLVAFFVSSSLLSWYHRREKKALFEMAAKSSQRDLGQALANGGWGALMALLYTIHPTPLLFAAFVGAMAAVTADTWATEMGVLSREPPRRITTGKTVPPGTSGGVSVLGTAAALAGALFIGLVAVGLHLVTGWVTGQDIPPWALGLPLAAGLGGIAGAFFDSLLGATLQRVYWCEHCQTETEQPEHTCGQRTQPLRGWAWIDNDVVNFLASIVGSSITLGVIWLFLWLNLG